MKTCDYLDAVQTKLNISSDYAVAKSLNISRQAVSRYRAGFNFLDDEVALRVAEILEINAGCVLIDMHAERSKNSEVRNVWEMVSAGFPALLLLANSSKGFSPAW